MSFCDIPPRDHRGGLLAQLTYFICNPAPRIGYSAKYTVSLISLSYVNALATQARQLEVIGIISIYYGNLHFSTAGGTEFTTRLGNVLFGSALNLALHSEALFRAHRICPSFAHMMS